MSLTQTYDNYYRAYYLKNRKKILARTKDYRRKYARDYYYKKKAEKIAAERASKAALDAQAPSKFTGLTRTVVTSVDDIQTFNDPLPELED